MLRLLVGPLTLLLSLGALAAPPAPPPPPVQATTFAGTVTDAATSRPIGGAQVSIVGTSRRAVTSQDGRYVMTTADARGSQVTLRVSVIGYDSQQRTATAGSDPVRVDFRLSTSAVSLDALVVTGVAGATQSRREVGYAVSSVAVESPPAPAGAQVQIRGATSVAAASPPPVAQSGPHPGLRRAREPGNTEAYAVIDENDFLAVANEPLSTFSADVDRASYANLRRFLNEGQRPPGDAVRVEEMINYFPYDYAAPRGEHPIAVTTEVADAPWRAGHRLLRVGLRTAAVDMRRAPPSNLVFLVDVSGSMAPADRLPLVKQSLRLLVEQLRDQDRVAMVVYAGAAGLVLPSTPGSERATIMDAIERLDAGGSTAGGAGLRLAYEVARQHHIRGGNNRVILATDGDFNVGVSSDAEMTRLIEEKRGQGTLLSVLGFGRGNLKDSKMELLADRGNGNYAYIDNLLEARKTLVQEMGGTLLTVAKDVKLQVEFNPARVRAYRLIGYENRLLASEDFNDDRRDAGEMGAGHTVTALYEIIPAGVRSDAQVRGVDDLRYAAPARPAAVPGGELAFVKVRYKRPDGETSRLLEHPVREGRGAASADLTFAAAVAGFGMLLRESEHRGTLTLAEVIRMAERSRGDDAGGYRAEFVRLARRFGEIDGGRRPGDEDDER